ncbi:hypothetical protein FB461_0777 [Rarobacter faecitabidus]|uniref:Uncharacterized protein n=1 Tax=Rarobacter faecitabidus TaxID=13243 RepID=A0A542ZVF4_RARFA|nr:hypothetical protein FB461_0777 [Rarobacter faecitabidus]
MRRTRGGVSGECSLRGGALPNAANTMKIATAKGAWSDLSVWPRPLRAGVTCDCSGRRDGLQSEVALERCLLDAVLQRSQVASSIRTIHQAVVVGE